MNRQLDANEIKRVIYEWPSLYEAEDGSRFIGSPVSQIPQMLRDFGRWRNVSRLNDAYDLAKMGLQIVKARYVGGVRPKQYCQVVVAGPPKPKGETEMSVNVNKWNKQASDLLVGRKIVKAEYMSKSDADYLAWRNRPLVITLDNGVTLYPTQDDEGNGPGALYTNQNETPILPVL